MSTYQNFEETQKKIIKLYATRHTIIEPNGLKHVEHPKKKTLKDLKSTWIVGHIKILRRPREKLTKVHAIPHTTTAKTMV